MYTGGKVHRQKTTISLSDKVCTVKQIVCNITLHNITQHPSDSNMMVSCSRTAINSSKLKFEAHDYSARDGVGIGAAGSAPGKPGIPRNKGFSLKN